MTASSGWEQAIARRQNGCWIWIGTLAGTNGVIYSYQSKNWISARAYIWTTLRGTPPVGKLRTTCHESLCVNPDHAYDRSAWRGEQTSDICKADDCLRPWTRPFGYCNPHYRQYLRYGPTLLPEGCERGPTGHPWRMCCKWGHPLGDAYIDERGRRRCRECKKIRNHRVRQLVRDGECWISAQTIFERDRWICAGCGGCVDATLVWPDPLSATLDHILPVSRGGQYEANNLQLMHAKCNLSKNDRLEAGATT